MNQIDTNWCQSYNLFYMPRKQTKFVAAKSDTWEEIRHMWPPGYELKRAFRETVDACMRKGLISHKYYIPKPQD